MPSPSLFAVPPLSPAGSVPTDLASELTGSPSGQAMRKLVERYQNDPAAVAALQEQHEVLQAALTLAQRPDTALLARRPCRAGLAHLVDVVLGEGSCDQGFRRAFRTRALCVHPDKTIALSAASKRPTNLCFQAAQAAYELALHTFQDPWKVQSSQDFCSRAFLQQVKKLRVG